MPSFKPTFELLKWMNENIESFYKGGAYRVLDAISYVRVNWLLNDYGII